MNLMDYGSDDDSCIVDEVDLEECERVQETDLPPVNDLEFIQSMAADFCYEYTDTQQTSNHPETNKVVNMKDENDSDSVDSSDNESETEGIAGGVDTAKAEVSSSSSSDSSDSEDENIATKKGYKKAARLISMYTEEEGDDVPSGPLKTKNEVDEVVEPINPDLLTIEDTSALICIGEVKYRIDHECVVVIQADFTTSPLNEGSILCNIDGKVLGKIQEIFGPITTPYYTVRWKNTTTSAVGNNNKTTGTGGGKNNKKNKGKRGKGGGSAPTTAATTNTEAEAVTEDTPSTPTTATPTVVDVTAIDSTTTGDAAMLVEKTEGTDDKVTDTTVPTNPTPTIDNSALQITDVRALFPVGAKLFSAPAHCTYVLPGQMKQLRSKGSDASNAYDEEPPEDEMEFSDDEQEMLAKQARKQKLKSAKGGVVVDNTVGDAIPCGRPERYGSGRGGGRGSGRGAVGGRGGGAGWAAGMSAGMPMYGGMPMMQPGMGGAYGQQAMGYPTQMPMQVPMQQLPMGYSMHAGYPPAGFQGYAPMQSFPGPPAPVQGARPPPPSVPAQPATVPYMATPQQTAGYMPPAGGAPYSYQQQQFMHAQHMQGGYQQGYAMMGGAGAHHLQQQAQQQQGTTSSTGPPQYTYQPLPFNQQQQPKR